jgi:hypothetical protein
MSNVRNRRVYVPNSAGGGKRIADAQGPRWAQSGRGKKSAQTLVDSGKHKVSGMLVPLFPSRARHATNFRLAGIPFSGIRYRHRLLRMSNMPTKIRHRLTACNMRNESRFLSGAGCRPKAGTPSRLKRVSTGGLRGISLEWRYARWLAAALARH